MPCQLASAHLQVGARPLGLPRAYNLGLELGNPALEARRRDGCGLEICEARSALAGLHLCPLGLGGRFGSLLARVLGELAPARLQVGARPLGLLGAL